MDFKFWIQTVVSLAGVIIAIITLVLRNKTQKELVQSETEKSDQKELKDSDIQKRFVHLDKKISNEYNIGDYVEILKALNHPKYRYRTDYGIIRDVKRVKNVTDDTIKEYLGELLQHGLTKMNRGPKETLYTLSQKGLQIFED